MQIRSDVEDGEIPTKNIAENHEIVEIGKVNGHIVISESDSDVMSVQNDKRFVHHVQAKKRPRYMIVNHFKYFWKFSVIFLISNRIKRET